jgi:HK97 family phage portal protein
VPSMRARLAKAFGVRANDPWLTAALTSRYGSSWNTGSIQVNTDTALRLSTVWRCISLRANLVSALDLDVYRMFQGLEVEIPPAAGTFFDEPADDLTMPEWLFMSQTDLDRFGNSVGIIVERDGFGLPRRVELESMAKVTMSCEGPKVVKYRIAGKDYTPDDVWHERGFRVPGRPDGLSPIMYGAWTVGGYLSAQKFGNDYFAKGGSPTTTIKNVTTNNVAPIAEEMKERFRAAVADRDIFVHGKDWEWSAAQAGDQTSAFLEGMKYEAADVCRFFGVPAEMVGAGVSGSAITYANITQLNLQFLITEIGPLLKRREVKLSRALPLQRYVKFDPSDLLRMDPETRERVLLARVAGRTLAPSEARAEHNLAPFTPDQIDEISTLLPAKIEQPPQETKA